MQEASKRTDDGIEAGLQNLQTESERLDHLVAELSEEQWRSDTPAQGWTIADQIGHLTWTDEVACWSIDDDPRWSELTAANTLSIDDAAHELAALPRTELLHRWRASRSALATRLLHHRGKVNWFGPPMAPRSMVSARIMETWAHGVDVGDTLGAAVSTGPALRDIAHLGVRTRDYAYLLHGRRPPSEEFGVELRGPAGESWTWGPEDAEHRLSGPAVDFCLLVTRRRHPDDLCLHHTGLTGEWVEIAQAFAGPPGTGRRPVRS